MKNLNLFYAKLNPDTPVNQYIEHFVFLFEKSIDLYYRYLRNTKKLELIKSELNCDIEHLNDIQEHSPEYYYIQKRISEKEVAIKRISSNNGRLLEFMKSNFIDFKLMCLELKKIEKFQDFFELFNSEKKHIDLFLKFRMASSLWV